MLETLLRILLVWCGTNLLSILNVLLTILFMICNEQKKERMYEKYGLKDYFSHKGGSKIYLLLLVPFLNIIVTLYLFLIASTDLGDDNNEADS